MLQEEDPESGSCGVGRFESRGVGEVTRWFGYGVCAPMSLSSGANAIVRMCIMTDKAKV